MITLWHSLGGTPGVVLEDIVKDYNKEHKQNLVELVFVNPKEYASSAKDALQLLSDSSEDLSKVPDVVLAPEYMTGEMLKAQEKGDVISLSELLDQERLEDIAEIVKKTFGPHCLPLNPACGVLYINKTVLEEIGEDPNWKPDSLEDLADMSRRMMNSNKVDNGYTCAWPEAYIVEAVLAQQNKSLFNEEDKYNFSQLGQHIFEMWKLVKEGVFLPPATGNYDPTRQFFINRKVAFYMQGSGHSTLIENEAIKGDFKVGYAPLPKLSIGQEDKYAFPLGGAALWALNKLPKNLSKEVVQDMTQGVRDFLDYFASKKVQEKWHRDTAYVPVSKSLIEELHEFYITHPLHAAVVSQTIGSKVGENSFGIKKAGYSEVRKQLYPLIHELITQEGAESAVKEKIREQLENFDIQCNK
jgi:sn-glycerol 3-phosphate transport system substrate-binding protein